MSSSRGRLKLRAMEGATRVDRMSRYVVSFLHPSDEEVRALGRQSCHPVSNCHPDNCRLLPSLATKVLDDPKALSELAKIGVNLSPWTLT